MTFTKAVSIKGDLRSTYVFKDTASVNKWLRTDFKEIQKKYKVKINRVFDLDGLQLGDSCYVVGDGDERYTVVGITRFSENRFGFILSSGVIEEVNKCYR